MSIVDAFAKNSLAWILAGLLLVAVHGSYQRGKELRLICELTGPHDVSFGNPTTPRQKIDTICASRDYDGGDE